MSEEDHADGVSTPWRRPAATGIGSLPGEDIVDAVDMVFDTVPDLPFLPELPARGATANLIGRAVAIITDLGFDLQPAGWRLTGSSGGSALDQRRARSLLAQDLDALEERAQEYVGPLKLQVVGPWTLAATAEKPRGDKVLADVGARRELGEALVEGLRTHLADVRRRVGGADLIVQVDEPSLPAVMGGGIATSSGFHRHRSVDAPLALAGLEPVFAAIRQAGAEPIAHCCAGEAPIALLRGAGAAGVSVDVLTLAASQYDALATSIDEGERAYLGVLASTDAAIPSERSVVDRVRRLLDMVGFDLDEVVGQLVLTPTCGLAGATTAYSREALRLLHATALAVG